jgi:hypothetical protein
MTTGIAAIEKRVKELDKALKHKASAYRKFDSGYKEGIRFASQNILSDLEKHEEGSAGNRHVYIPNLDWLSLKEKLLKLGDGKNV